MSSALMTSMPGLRDALSRPRFEAYRGSAASTDLECLTRYVWNVALCEALYPTIQHLEVALRNAIHGACTREFGSELWFDIPSIIDDPMTLRIIADAKGKLTRTSKPIEGGRVVAELHFGFWRQLFYAKYETKLWRRIVKDVFPHAPPENQQRSKIGPKVHNAKELRNRVFHHEPVFHWANLRDHHREMHTLITWISPELAALAAVTDRFPEVSVMDLAVLSSRLGCLAVMK